jgi:hypothetical protein
MNIGNITTALREAYPSALIQTALLEEMEPMEQFTFWSQQSLVIAAHGAGLMNAIFLPPGNASAVIEIFPPHYYAHNYFGSLQGHVASGVMDTTTTNRILLQTGRYIGSTSPQRRVYRNVDLEPPVEDILGLVRKALLEGERNVYTGT